MSVCVHTSLAQAASEPILDSLATAAYVPAYPSKLGAEWSQWEKSADELIAVIAGDAKHRATAVDIEYEAKRAGLEGSLVFAMVEVLSRFDSHHEASPRNQGLLQLDPRLNARYGQKEHTLYQAKYNLRLGCTLFRHYIEQAQGDISRAMLRFLTEASPQRDPTAIAQAILKQRSARVAQLQKYRPIAPAAAK